MTNKKPSIFDIINNIGTEYTIKNNKGDLLKTKEQKKEHFKRIGLLKTAKKGGSISQKRKKNSKKNPKELARACGMIMESKRKKTKYA